MTARQAKLLISMAAATYLMQFDLQQGGKWLNYQSQESIDHKQW